MKPLRSRVVEIPAKESTLEGRYRELLDAVPDALVVVNSFGKIVLLNVQAELQFGFHRDELLGRPVITIIPEGLSNATKDARELTARRKDGSEFPIEVMLSRLEDTEGILVTAAIRDITARKRAEANLLRSNQELAQFACVVSHDLQEPMRMVTRYTELLAKRYKGKLDADADQFIAFAVDGATSMQRLIQDLLEYSCSGQKEADLLTTSAEEALRQALVNLHSAVEESGALVTHDPLPALPAIQIQLVQLFQNLIGNAIKYQGPRVPLVHVSAARTGDQQWMFSIRDNGMGIDPQNFEKIFVAFQRLHKQSDFAGSGLGLAICKKIVERHGGSISVESQPGKGSTFRFTLTGGAEK